MARGALDICSFEDQTHTSFHRWLDKQCGTSIQWNAAQKGKSWSHTGTNEPQSVLSKRRQEEESTHRLIPFTENPGKHQLIDSDIQQIIDHLGTGSGKDREMRDSSELLGVTGYVHYRDCGNALTRAFMSKLTKLYTLNTCN